ncbi:MAG: DUF1667 domain-containing protein [Bacilli bacterium]|nr:DUF1667 domain-containing protein [Bacilli bacterium]
MKEMICIVCPKGCHIKVDDNGVISGYTCKRGLEYAQNELTCPKRNISTTVKLISKKLTRLPVTTNGDIPKEKIFEIMELLNNVVVKAPVNLYDIIVKDVLGTSVDIIATRTVKE